LHNFMRYLLIIYY